MHARTLLALVCFIIIVPASPIFAEDDPPEFPPETPERTVSLTLRDGETMIFAGNVAVPDSETATTSISASDGTIADALAASALAALIIADTAAPEFSISNLQYFSSYGSFYTKCITHAVEKCDNWQYVVGDEYPSVGMDQYILHDGDTLFVYFGSPRRVTLGTTTVALDESFSATAERYVPASDSYVPAPGVTIGITQTNPDDPYTPLVIATSSADAAGSAIFTLSATGTYAVGIAEDYYYPTIPLTVEAPAAPTPEETAPEAPLEQPQQSNGGASSAPSHVEVDIPAALSFLAANQNADGSFATPLLSDWAALAFAATPEYESGETTLRRYLIDTRADFSSVTDYERRAMALIALSVNPYSDTTIDYIAKILSYFDGTQFGDASLINDDIFAIFPLLSGGYGEEDEIIQKTAAFIIGKQRSDGSWDGSVDVTAAALQALSSLRSLPGAQDALSRATTYLHAEERADGGFGNSFSTSWALQAIHALPSDMTSWQSGGRYPEDYLASLQFSDGGIESASTDSRTRIWATEYAIPAALGKPWLSLMHAFEKPLVPQQEDRSSSQASVAATTSAAFTIEAEETALPTESAPEIIAAVENPRARPRATNPSALERPDREIALPAASVGTMDRAQVAGVATAIPDTSGFGGLFSRVLGWFQRLLGVARAILL